MTTIVTDGKMMAADSRLGGDVRHGHFQKLVVADDGAILGAAGHASDQATLVRWYRAFRVSERAGTLAEYGPPKMDPPFSKDFEGLILRKDGTILAIEYDGTYLDCPAPSAVGSGTRFAYGAMDAGVTPEQAVTIACGRDAFSDLPVQVLYLED